MVVKKWNCSEQLIYSTSDGTCDHNYFLFGRHDLSESCHTWWRQTLFRHIFLVSSYYFGNKALLVGIIVPQSLSHLVTNLMLNFSNRLSWKNNRNVEKITHLLLVFSMHTWYAKEKGSKQWEKPKEKGCIICLKHLRILLMRPILRQRQWGIELK